ncbi:MAG: cupin domain-containing protein [Alphaproteobacteria bacterium]
MTGAASCGWTLADLLSPASEAAFREVWGRVHLHVPGAAGKFSNLFGWPELNRLLEQQRLAAPRLRLTHAGDTVDEREYLIRLRNRAGDEKARLDVPALYRHLQNGATLNLNDVEEMSPALTPLVAGLARVFHVRPQVNLYATWGMDRGFGVHWDSHDVFVLQIAGQKCWQVYGFTRESPLFRDVQHDDTPPGQPICEAVLTAGDLLYLPRGYWHDATGQGEPTLHLTIGVPTPTGIDLMTWLVDSLRDDVRFRRDLPVLDPPARRRAAAELRDALTERCTDDMVERFLESRLASLAGPPRLSLPLGPAGLMDDDLRDETRIGFAGVSFTNFRAGPEPGQIRFEALGRQWVLSEKLGPALEALLSGKTMTVGNVRKLTEDAVTDAGLKRALAKLIGEGLLCLER